MYWGKKCKINYIRIRVSISLDIEKGKINTPFVFRLKVSQRMKITIISERFTVLMWKHLNFEFLFFYSVVNVQGRKWWLGRMVNCPPSFWQISWPYLNQGGTLCPTHYYVHNQCSVATYAPEVHTTYPIWMNGTCIYWINYMRKSFNKARFIIILVFFIPNVLVWKVVEEICTVWPILHFEKEKKSNSNLTLCSSFSSYM